MRLARLLWVIVLSTIPAGRGRAATPARVVYSDIRGVVQAVDPGRREVTIRHEKIPGYMDSMTMPFAVKDPRILQKVKPQEPVIFELIVTPQEAYVDAIVPDQTSPMAPAIPPKPPDNARWIHVPKLGEAIPDIALTNQDGRRVRLRNYQGKVLALNFVYTQCPLPTYCPLSMATFASVRQKLGAAAGKDVVLFTLTFDPRHDTPDRLKAFGRNYGADPDSWQLLTGKPEEVEKAVSFFDINYWTSTTGSIQEHTLSTVLVNQAGYVARFYTGPDVKADDLFADIQEILRKGI
jgi:protein SCO1